MQFSHNHIKSKIIPATVASFIKKNPSDLLTLIGLPWNPTEFDQLTDSLESMILLMADNAAPFKRKTIKRKRLPLWFNDWTHILKQTKQNTNG